MDPSVSTSFIPKKSFDSGPARGTGAATGLFLLIAILIFIASLVAAGGAFAYQQLLTKQIAAKSASLTLNEKAYDPTVIQELLRVDTRLTEAKKLLDKHLAPSAIFAFLSQQTLEKVQFTSFTFGNGSDGAPAITLKGLADSFSTVALQSDQFGASKVLKEVVFSDVSADPITGKIGFSVTASVAPSLLLFTNETGTPGSQAPAASTTTP